VISRLMPLRNLATKACPQIHAGHPFVGRVSHLLEDISNFMNSSHDSLPSDQFFLVAPNHLRSGLPIGLTCFLTPRIAGTYHRPAFEAMGHGQKTL
jgi:hypothetical protein